MKYNICNKETEIVLLVIRIICFADVVFVAIFASRTPLDKFRCLVLCNVQNFMVLTVETIYEPLNIPKGIHSIYLLFFLSNINQKPKLPKVDFLCETTSVCMMY